MADQTHWLVRHDDGERYLAGFGRWVPRSIACRYTSVDMARCHCAKLGGVVVRVTVLRHGDRRYNACEHGDHSAPDGKRFCSNACLRCEHESESENGCDGICNGVKDDNA